MLILYNVQNYNYSIPLKRMSEYKKVKLQPEIIYILADSELWMTGNLTGSVNQGNYVISGPDLYFLIMQYACHGNKYVRLDVKHTPCEKQQTN